MRETDITEKIRALSVYPYDEYKVTLKPKAHLHYAYRITDKGIEIELSDYLAEAPLSVLNDECEAIVKWSMGKKYVQPASLSEYLVSSDFIVKNRPLYLRRCRTVSMTQQGSSKNLIDSVERLMAMDLVFDTDISNSYFTWATHMAKYKFGQCNQTFRVVSINPDLDADYVPDKVVDYVVYHEILHLRQDTSKNHRPHNAQFRSWEHMFPDYAAMEDYLRKFYTVPGRRRLCFIRVTSTDDVEILRVQIIVVRPTGHHRSRASNRGCHRRSKRVRVLDTCQRVPSSLS